NRCSARTSMGQRLCKTAGERRRTVRRQHWRQNLSSRSPCNVPAWTKSPRNLIAGVATPRSLGAALFGKTPVGEVEDIGLGQDAVDLPGLQFEKCVIDALLVRAVEFPANDSCRCVRYPIDMAS